MILLNGFFAGAEIAVISARAARIQPLADKGSRSARALLRLKENPDRFLATVQIGVTVVGTLASAVAGVAAIERLEPLFASVPIPWVARVAEPLAVGCVVFAISYASLVVGELTPKSLAIRHAEPLALVVARPIEWLSRISGAAVSTLTASTGVLLRLLRQKQQARMPFHTLEDLRALIREAEEQGLVAGGLVRGAFEIQDCDVREVMTPRSRMVAIDRRATPEEALRVADDSGYSRFPVFEGSLDDVKGILHARDLYQAALRPGRPAVASLVRPAILMPETKRASELLSEMRRSRNHMAVVVDEHGAVAGLATLEDLFEIIVGAIEDEHETAEQRVRTVADGVLEADASLPVRQLNNEAGLALPESDDYVTVAGLVLQRLGTLPVGGEVVFAGAHRLTVLAVDGRRVTRVRVERRAPAPDGA
jgi:putative hemolysin